MLKSSDDLAKLYPGWKHAAQTIVDMVKEKGYGFMLTHETLLGLFDLETPEGKILYKEAQDFNFKKMAHTVSMMSTLLYNHNIKLLNIRGIGYKVLHPNDQIKIGAIREIERAIKMLLRAIDTLIHIDNNELISEVKKLQERLISGSSFMILYGNQKCLGKVKDKRKNKGDNPLPLLNTKDRR